VAKGEFNLNSTLLSQVGNPALVIVDSSWLIAVLYCNDLWDEEMNEENKRACAIAVMAKAPLAGRCKTRLVPPLSPEEAAMLSAAFLRDVTENIAAAARTMPVHGYIAYAPIGSEAMFDGHVALGTALVLADGSVDMPRDVEGFGRCLLHAVQSLFMNGYGAVCVVNSDSPTLPTRFLTLAAKLLDAQGDRAVLGPADDGGYYLLGVKAPHVHLFEDISWSTPNVAEQTITRAREIGLDLMMLPAWYDVDDVASLYRLIGDLDADTLGQKSRIAFAAPATAACVESLRLDTLMIKKHA
jgi:rSAM/selenodomain-associated transferase 1